MSRSTAPARRWRLGLLVAVLAATLGDKGCDPNYIGVQEYGAITGRVYDASNNKAINNALVSVGSLYVTRSDPQGAFTLPKVPVGTQQVVITATGFQAIAAIPVAVGKNKTAVIDQPVGLTPVGSTPAPAPVATPTAAATPVAAPSTSNSASPAPAASGAPAPRAS